MIECSSDPNSELNCARRELCFAKLFLSSANRWGDDKSTAMRRLNLQRNRLRKIAHKLRGQKSTRLPVDFTTKACGIPCGVVIESYSSDVDEIEYTICTAKGYRMDWLDKRVHADTEEDATIVLEIQDYRCHGSW